MKFPALMTPTVNDSYLSWRPFKSRASSSHLLRHTPGVGAEIPRKLVLDWVMQVEKGFEPIPRVASAELVAEAGSRLLQTCLARRGALDWKSQDVASEP